MDLIDRLLSPRARAWLERAQELACAALMFVLTWQIWLKAGKIAAYGDTTDVLRIKLAPFIYLMVAMIAISGLVHLYLAFVRRR
jgi:TRAP-type C4-dicarboxylate transport system permease small subunit